MGIEDLRQRLKKRFVGKFCRVKGEVAQGEIFTLAGFREVKQIVDVVGPPSAWYWQAKLKYQDGTKSNWFEKMRDVEIDKRPRPESLNTATVCKDEKCYYCMKPAADLKSVYVKEGNAIKHKWSTIKRKLCANCRKWLLGLWKHAK